MNAQLLDQLTQAATYRELQAALKSAIAQGYKSHCKLNAKKEDLAIARNTLVWQINQEFQESVQIKKPLTDAEEDAFIASIEEFNAHIGNDIDRDLLTGNTPEAIEYQIDLLQDMNYHQEADALRQKRDAGCDVATRVEKEIAQIEKSRERAERLWVPRLDPDQIFTPSRWAHLYGTQQFDLLMQIAIADGTEQSALHRSLRHRIAELGM